MTKVSFKQIVMGNEDNISDLYALDEKGRIWLLSDGREWQLVEAPDEPNPPDPNVQAYKPKRPSAY